MPIANGWRRGASAFNTAPRWSRISRRCTSSSPILRSARRRWCRRPRQLAIPALYFTNLISARPLFGPAGAGSLAQVVNAALAKKSRFDRWDFFDEVGDGKPPAIWEDDAGGPAGFPRAIPASRCEAAGQEAKVRS